MKLIIIMMKLLSKMFELFFTNDKIKLWSYYVS